MSKTSAGFNLNDSNALYLDNAIYKDRQGQLRQTSSELKFDKLPFELENGACGTEGMVLLSDYWHGVSKASDNLQNFFTVDVDKVNTDTQNSINQTDAKIGNSFSVNLPNYRASMNISYMVPPGNTKSASNISSVSGIAGASSAVVYIIDNYRNAFLSVYDVDEETMALAEEWIEEYNAGNPVIIQKMKKYQHLTAEQWENLSDEELKEFTTLTVVYAWCNYVVEQGGDGITNFDTYTEICEKMTANLYSFNAITEGYDYVEASADAPLIFSMKTAMESLGMSDSLAYNIATKVER